MCWINWFIKKIDNAGIILDNMNKSIIHRWPDDQWTLVSDALGWKKIWLWHVRLSIIDLTDAWFQPMYYNKKVWCFSKKHNSNNIEKYWDISIKIVFNWEIYNYKELKDILLRKWYKFSSETDTEVVLASYLERWNDCVNRFNGMRSFAIYNPISCQLFCSRDRLWKKPFYYYFDWESFIFSSEIKWLLEHKELKFNKVKNIDKEAIDFYFTMQYIPAPRSIYKNIKKLEARHNIVVTVWYSKKLTLENYCYYNIPKYKPLKNKKLIVEEWEILLNKTVKERMFSSDVPVWANLSWWLDSSSIVAKMIEYVDRDSLHTFSVWFEWKYDESKYINMVNDKFWTKHHHEYFWKNDFESMLDNIYYFYDEPFWDDSIFPTLFVSQLAWKNVKVVLTWDWWDEIFWWYLMHQLWAQMELLWKIPKNIRTFLHHIIPKKINKFSFLWKIKNALKISLCPKSEFYYNIQWTSFYKPKTYLKRVKEKMSEILEATDWNFTQAMIDFDLFYNTLSDNFLVKTDRASMSQSIEYRSPYCDLRWINRSRKCPVKWKVNFRNTKIIWKEIAKNLVPNEILNRGKQWFKPPIENRISSKKFIKENLQYLEILYKSGVLNKKWYISLKKQINCWNYMWKIMQLRLYMFILRYKQWIK